MTGIRQWLGMAGCVLTLAAACSAMAEAPGWNDDFDDAFSGGAAEDAQASGSIYDPLEPVNRVIFDINRTVDGWIFEPAARVYRGVIPEYGRERVGFFMRNLHEPINCFNGVLQGDPEQAFTSLWRFIINTTFGVVGIFDAADEVGLSYREEDFGQTLAVYGVDGGPYLMLPLLGPSNLRDGVGMAVDIASDPFTYAFDEDRLFTEKTGYVITGVNLLHQRSLLLDPLEDIYNTALDPYASVRSLYHQRREAAIRNDHAPLHTIIKEE